MIVYIIHHFPCSKEWDRRLADKRCSTTVHQNVNTRKRRAKSRHRTQGILTPSQRMVSKLLSESPILGGNVP